MGRASEAAAERGVEILIVLFGTDPGEFRYNDRCQVYLHEGTGVRMGTADNLFTLTIDHSEAVTVTTDRMTAFHTRNYAVVQMADSLIRHDYYMAEIHLRFGKQIRGFSPEAEATLLHHSWPGNVRELENTVERAAILCVTPTITLEDLPGDLVPGASGDGPASADAASLSLAELERRHTLRVLRSCGGHRGRTGRGRHARQPVVHGPREVAAVGHHLEPEGQDVPHRVVLALQEGIAPLAQHIEEQHRALPGIKRIGGPGEEALVGTHGLAPVT